MEIGKKQSTPWLRPLLVAGLLLLAFVTGLWLGHVGWWTQVRQGWQQSVPSLRAQQDARLPMLVLDVPFANYDALLAQRAEALEQGVFIGEEADFVTADVSLDGVRVPVRLRLQQGTAVHLGDGEKWNLEVRTRDDARLLDMTRFQLIDPADNNWLHEWAFLETMRREGLPAVRYHFVRLQFNGEDWGIYAVQEGFAPPLLAANDRPPGVIVEFDAESLWQSIRYYAGDEAAAMADPVTNLSATDFQFFAIDTFRDATIARDEALSLQKETAIGLLRGLQGGKVPAAAVFDVAQYGQFLALVDLWGAVGTTKLVNLRYYYHPEEERLQPIAFNGNALAVPERVSPAAAYHDPEIQLAYAQAAARYSDPAFLAELQIAFNDQLAALLQAMEAEATLTLPWDSLAARQAQMRRSLDPVQPLFAYLAPPDVDADRGIRIEIANAVNLPLEIVGFDVGGAAFVAADPVWVQVEDDFLLLPEMEGLVLAAHDAQETAVLRYVPFHLPLDAIRAREPELRGLGVPTIWVVTRLPGSDELRRTAARPDYPPPLVAPVGE